ncbi:MAG: ribosome silencing factor [Microscillaceae bacterium]|nr:ribosome silencing factor [Microscillaceae bacterium]MDW8461370.1 ribosome silencing factor [Cytophagales bacterium]
MSKTLKKTRVESAHLSRIIAKGMQEKKGQDIRILDLRKVKNAFTDFFVICTGTSTTQVDALADSVEEFTFKLAQENARHKEGKESKEWILLDYIDVVVHIFTREKREFYALEDLWGDALFIDVPPEGDFSLKN